VLSAEALESMPAFHRYRDVDGDGIAWRTLPGAHPKGAYFVRGSGHNQHGAYTEDAAEYRQVLDRLARKFRTAADLVPGPVVQSAPGARAGVVSMGSCDEAVREALDVLAARGVALDYLRVRAFPFNGAVQEFLDAHDEIFVVEQNRDAQLRSLLTLETDVDKRKLVPVLHYNGLPLYADFIVQAIAGRLERGKAA
jgi:2-oxoglutarate ferredoxin oxidoreductase subunit alpha